MTQTTDAALVKRLRARSDADAEYGWRSRAEEYAQAADTIEAQARRIEALEGAAKLVARAVGVSVMPDGTHWAMVFPRSDPQPLLADIFSARAALEPTP